MTDQPLEAVCSNRISMSWRKPAKVFPNSTSDFFHEALPDSDIDKLFAVMALCPHLTFQIPTKRAERMRAYMTDSLRRNAVELAAEKITPSIGKPWSPKHCFKWPLPNVWLGVSTERQQEADERIPSLLRTPASVRFISGEPLLGHVDIWPWLRSHSSNRNDDIQGKRIDWVIVGGESGANARPMHPQWARDLREQCAAAGVPFFFKQWGEWAEAPVGTWEGEPGAVGSTYTPDIEPADMWFGRDGYFAPKPPRVWSPAEFAVMRRVGKKAAGRLLDGKEHNDFPEARP